MIQVRVYEAQEDAFLEIKVVDSGIGIKKDDQKKLFKLFGFIDKNKDQNTQGIGFGLAISKMLVEEFEGKLEYEENPSLGSTFKFSLKLENTPNKYDPLLEEELIQSSSFMASIKEESKQSLDSDTEVDDNIM